MVRYPFDVLRAVSQVEPLTMNGSFVRPEVYPPSAAPEATRVSKGEQGGTGASGLPRELVLEMETEL